MKRVTAIVAAILLVAGCAKDESTQYVELNVREVVSMIGKQSDYVRDNFSNAELWSDGSTLRFHLLTKESNYSVSFKSNASGVVTSAVVYGSLEKGYGIDTYRAESDKVNSSISHVSYIARYGSSTAGLIDFSDRAEFWAYLGEKGVNTAFTETWGIENTADVKFTVKGQFYASTNAIEFDIDRNEW